MDFLEYIVEEALILIPVLLILGKIIKKTPNVPDWLIPYILLGVGIATSGFLMGLNVEAFIQGVLVTGASVLGYELFKQGKEKH